MTYVDIYRMEIQKEEDYIPTSNNEKKRVLDHLEHLIFDKNVDKLDGSCDLKITIEARGNP